MKHIIPLLTAALLTPASALAANDGTLGTESSGDFEITYTVTDSPNIRISGFEHVHFDYRIGDPLPPAKEMDICVYMDQPGEYGLRIEYEVLSDTNTAYKYQMRFREQAGIRRSINATINDSGYSQHYGIGGAPTTIDDDCATDGPTAKLEFSLANDLERVPTTQTATGAIKFTVTPD